MNRFIAGGKNRVNIINSGKTKSITLTHVPDPFFIIESGKYFMLKIKIISYLNVVVKSCKPISASDKIDCTAITFQGEISLIFMGNFLLLIIGQTDIRPTLHAFCHDRNKCNQMFGLFSGHAPRAKHVEKIQQYLLLLLNHLT